MGKKPFVFQKSTQTFKGADESQHHHFGLQCFGCPLADYKHKCHQLVTCIINIPFAEYEYEQDACLFFFECSFACRVRRIRINWWCLLLRDEDEDDDQRSLTKRD